MDSNTCILCGRVKKQVFSHKNDKINSKLVFCKTCVNKLADLNNPDSVKDMCRMMNVAYDDELRQKLIDDNQGNATMGNYLKIIAMRANAKFINVSDVPSNNSLQDLSKLKQKWGDGYEDDKYFSFEREFEKLSDIREPHTELEVKKYIQNVKMGDILNAALQSADVKSITSLRKAYNDDLESLGFGKTSSDAQATLTLGERIKRWEMTDPVPEPDDSFDEQESKKDYINKWFVTTMKKALGIATEEEVSRLDE